MKILLAAPLFVPGEPLLNIAIMEGVVSRHAPSQPDLCVFPEVSLQGGFWAPGESAWLKLAETIPDGPSCQQVVELARRFHTSICAGAIERDGADHYVTHYICGPTGVVGKQRKLFPASPTSWSALRPGQTLVPLALQNQVCTILACSDWLLPEPSILAGLLGSALIICPTDCFSRENEGVVLSKLQGRAADTGAHVAAVFGRTPDDQGPVLNAIVCAPNGELLVYEHGRADCVFELLVELELKQPRAVWGGFATRWERLMAARG